MKTAALDKLSLKVSYTDPTACWQLSRQLGELLEGVPPERRIAVVCLGTDRSTGDSLGPLTGSSLARYRSPWFELYGTLEEPVHAKNLEDTLAVIHRTLPHPFIVGIDACLGQPSSIGWIEVGEGPVCPGSGVNKQLPPVGDVHISGIVNVAGFMEYLVLQTTRLHVVMRMADLISLSVYRALAARQNWYNRGNLNER